MSETPFNRRWHLREDPWEPGRNQVWESLCMLGNGYLGVRGHADEPFEAGPSLVGTYAAGVFAPDPAGIPELVNVPNFLAVEILLHGRRVRLGPQKTGEYVRQLDMRTGVVRRSFVHSEQGRSTRIAFERFVSLTCPHLAGQQVTITPLNWSGRLEVRFFIDGGVRNLSKKHLQLAEARRVGADRAVLVTTTRGSGIRVATAFRSRAWVHHSAPPPPREPKGTGRNRIGVGYCVDLECGQHARFDRLVSVYTSRDPDAAGSVERQCLSDVRRSGGQTYGTVLRQHKEAWAAQWDRCDLEIDGPEEDQQAVRFSIFHLVQACSRFDPSVSIGAKALSGEAYRGHVFWDTEIFVLPFFVHTDPETARRLLEYRFHTLPGARRKAAQAGYSGAMFAWESADSGEETCPLFVPDPKTGEPVRVWCGEIEQHISADVMYGAYRYWLATGDRALYEDVLCEMAVETARFWASRVMEGREDGRYHIGDVIGPDEYHEHVDDSAFTNHMAAWNLRFGAECAQVLRRSRKAKLKALCQRLQLGPDESKEWLAVADKLHIPFDRRRRVHEQHQGFFGLAEADAASLSSRFSPDPEKVRMPRIWGSQVVKQADVLMLMALWPERFSDRVRRANWRYYEPRTTHDSSLSPSVHAMVAGDLGLRRRAYEYFRMTALTDLRDVMGNTRDGLHAAAMGGTWQAVLRGLLGMRCEGAELSFEPCLPRQWKAVHVQLQHRGRTFTLEVTQDSVRLKRRRPGAAGRNRRC